MKHNLNAYIWEDEDWPNEPFGDYLHRCMRYQKNLQPFKKCKSAWNILNRYYENIQTPSDHVIGNDLLTWQNLQLLCGEQEEQKSCYVAHLVDRTSTEIGRVTLRTWIAQPTDDYEILHNRQAVVRFLVENEEIFNQLDTYLSAFKQSEDFLLSFWLNDPLYQAANRYYFTLSRMKSVEKFLNSSTFFLASSAIFQHKQRILSTLTIGLTAAVLPIYGFARLTSDLSQTRFNTLAERLISAGGPIFSLFSFIHNHYLQSAGFIAAGFYCAVQAHDQFDWMKDNFILGYCLQTKLHHVTNCLRIIEKIGKISHNHPELQCSTNANIYSLVHSLMANNSEIHKLFKLLNSHTFNCKPSLVAHYGKILSAYKLLHEQTNNLESLLCALGELDAYMSIARLYKEFEHKRVHYSFVSYDTDTTQPVVVVKDLWSTFIDPSVVVPNSIEIGTTSSAHNLIITGPNEGGKSTFTKAITTLIILAQSIGIVPASEATITPFSYIATYLNITDDHGKSLFEAQVQRAKQILDHIDTMKPHQYSFVIIDELFNGTDARIGQATSYSIADYLSKYPNVVSIFPTHFPELTLLENNGGSINYKVSATIDAQGNINYPFVIEKGISQQNIVLDILRNEQFNPAIIEQAAEILNAQ